MVQQIPTYGIILDYTKLPDPLKRRALSESMHKETRVTSQKHPGNTCLGDGRHYAIAWLDNSIQHISTPQIQSYLLTSPHPNTTINSNAIPFLRGNEKIPPPTKDKPHRSIPPGPATGEAPICQDNYLKALAVEELRVRILAISSIQAFQKRKHQSEKKEFVQTEGEKQNRNAEAIAKQVKGKNPKEGKFRHM